MVYLLFAIFMIVSIAIFLWGIVTCRHEIKWAFKRSFRLGYRFLNPKRTTETEHP